MTYKETFESAVRDFIAGQAANADSPQAARLAYLFKTEIRRLREAREENQHALSLDAKYENGEFQARAAFREDYTMTILYKTDSDNATVDAIYSGLPEADNELCRLAGLMLSEGWVEGYVE